MRSVWMILILPMLVIIFSAISADAVPVEEWNKTYSNVGTIFDVQETRDGGYIFAASKHLPDGGLTGYGVKDVAFVVKTDANGNVQWKRTFDENIEKFNFIRGGAGSVQQTSDGGYTLAETSSRDGSGYSRVIKMDAGGNIEWIKKFENTALEGTVVLQTMDDGYFLEVSRISLDIDIWHIKLDTEGNEQRHKIFNGKNWDVIYSIQLTTDGYKLAGNTGSNGSSDALLIKTDMNGDTVWSKTFAGTNSDGFHSVQKTQDEGYILAGVTGAELVSDLMGNYYGDAWLIKVDADGKKQWEMIFKEHWGMFFNSARQTSDGGYIISGCCGWLAKFRGDNISHPASERVSSTLTVDDSGGANYTRIQDAIDNASNGDTILVYSGTYYESVNVDKRLVLRGVDTGGGKPVVDAGKGGSVAIALSAGNSTIEGFTIVNAATGIHVISNNNIIRNNTISMCYYGILLENSSNNILSDNNASNNSESIRLSYSSNNNILSGNIALNNNYGLWLDSSSNNALSGNNASYNHFGIFLSFSNHNMLSTNTANINKYYGIYLYNSNNNTLSNNTINLNNNRGVWLWYSDYNILSGNIAILNKETGIVLQDSDNNTLGGNIIDSNNYRGIELIVSSNNTIYNNFFNNIKNLAVQYAVNKDPANRWNIHRTNATNVIGGVNLAGNVWAYPNGKGFSQTCKDGNSDGICDLSYVIDRSNVDNLPLAYKASAQNPTEKATGFEVFMIITTLSAVYVFGRKGIKTKSMRLKRR